MSSPYGVRLPYKLHIKLETTNDRVIIIGDIHGCYDEFMLLLQKCNYNSKKDTLILVGDLSMKGPKSLEVIRYVCQNNILSVRGNVDENSLFQYEKLKKSGTNNWGDYEWMKELTNTELKYLYELPYSISLPKYNILVVHAGMLPNKLVKEQELNDLIRLRCIQDDGIGTKDFLSKDKLWINYWKGPEKIVFGHDAMRRLQKTDFAIGLDTACVYGYQLTALVLPSNKIVQVKSAKKYY